MSTAVKSAVKALKERLAAKKLEEKAAPAKREKAAYPAGKEPGKLFGSQGPHATTGPLGDQGYSLFRAAGFALGAIAPDQAKEEIHVHQQLSKMYEGYTWKEAPHRRFLYCTGSQFLPTRHPDGSTISENVKVASEIRQKSMATVANADPDEAAWVRRKALGTVSSTLGGSIVGFPTLGELIDLQRNMEAFSRAGASQVELPPNGRISFPKQTGGATAYWVGEAASVTESDLATGSLLLEAKKLGLITRLNNELLRFTGPTTEAMVRNDLAMQAALKADAAMFDGTGGTQIKGLFTYPTQTAWAQGTDKVILHTATTTGANGDTLEPQDIYKMLYKLPDPVQALPRSFLFRTPHAQTIMSKRADAVTASDQKGAFVWQQFRGVSDALPENIAGCKFVTSFNVPGNRVKGGGSDLTAVTAGAFADWLIGRFGVMELLMNPYDSTGFAQDQTTLRGIQHIDAGPRHLASFVYCDTLLQTA